MTHSDLDLQAPRQKSPQRPSLLKSQIAVFCFIFARGQRSTSVRRRQQHFGPRPLQSAVAILMATRTRCPLTPSPLSPSPGLRVPSVLEDAFVLPGWRRQDRLRVRPQVRGHVAKVRRRRRTWTAPRYWNRKTAAGGEGKVLWAFTELS